MLNKIKEQAYNNNNKILSINLKPHLLLMILWVRYFLTFLYISVVPNYHGPI